METELLHKYLSGNCTGEERNQVENWLRSSPENQKIMDEMKQIWNIPPAKRIDVNSEEAWNELQARVLGGSKRGLSEKMKKKPFQPYKNSGRRNRSYIRVLVYSMASAAVLIIAFLFSSHMSQIAATPEVELSMQEITTNKGQRTAVKLSDGTRVQMNGESKLMIPENFMDSNRVVILEGEAYFEVEPNADKKFLVHTHNSVTRVLGTKFNVRAYSDEESVEVVVAEGRVSMSSDEHMFAPEVQLTQNQRGTLSRNGEVTASTIADVELYMGWTKGQLAFKDATVQQVKTRLERWYDIEVVLEDDFSAEDQLLTGTFENVPLSVVLSSISLSLDLDYKQDGKTVIFSK